MRLTGPGAGDYNHHGTYQGRSPDRQSGRPCPQMRAATWRGGEAARQAFGVAALLALAMALVSGCSALPGPFTSHSQQLVAEGDRLAAANRAEEATLAYRQAADEDPRNLAALEKLAAAYAKEGRGRLAGRYLALAETLQPGSARGVAGPSEAQPPTPPAGKTSDQSAALLAGPPVGGQVSPLAGPPVGGQGSPPAGGSGSSTLQGPALQPAALATPGAGQKAPMRLVWQRAVGDSAPAGMALLDGVVYVALESGEVQALSAATGQVAWSVTLPGPITSAPGLGAKLMVVGSQDGTLYALAREDGHRLWTFATQAPIYAAPLLTDSLVYVPGGDGTLYAVGINDGVLRWKVPGAGSLHSSPALADGAIYYGSTDGRIYAVNATDGAARWGKGIPTGGAVESRAVIAQGRVLAGSDDPRLYALDAAAGGEYWDYPATGEVFAAPIVITDTVYTASNGGTLAALDLISGAERWETDAAGPILYTPAIDGRSLYVLITADPYLYAFDARTGQLQWKIDTGDWPGADPLLANGVLYLAGKDGTVLACRPAAP